MKKTIIFLILLSLIITPVRAFQLPEGGDIVARELEGEGMKVWEIFQQIFGWLLNQLKNLWSYFAGFLTRQIDTRKEYVEQRVEQETERVKESLLERFKKIIRYE